MAENVAEARHRQQMAKLAQDAVKAIREIANVLLDTKESLDGLRGQLEELTEHAEVIASEQGQIRRTLEYMDMERRKTDA